MSSSQSTNTKQVPTITDRLLGIIKDKTVSCTLYSTVSKVLSTEAIDEIATLDNIREYIGHPYERLDTDTIFLEIGHFPAPDLDGLAEKFRDRAARLFVLAVEYD